MTRSDADSDMNMTLVLTDHEKRHEFDFESVSTRTTKKTKAETTGYGQERMRAVKCSEIKIIQTVSQSCGRKAPCVSFNHLAKEKESRACKTTQLPSQQKQECRSRC